MKTSRIRKKILIVSPYFYPNTEWGGPVVVSWNLAQLLAQEGYFVEVLTTDVSYNPKKHENHVRVTKGIKIVYARSLFPVLSWKFRIFLSIDQINKGLKLIPGFDAVHFNDIFILQNFFLSVYCRKYKIPYIITAHGNLNFERERGKSWLKRLVYFLFAKSFVKGATKIIAMSRPEKEYIDTTFPSLSSKTLVIRHPILQDEFKKINIRSRFNIPKKNKIILFIGRIYPLKGVKELLFGYIRYLKTGSKPATLILAGPDAGGLNEIKQTLKLISGVNDNVILTGEVSGDLKYSLLSEADVVSLLSKSETIPTSLVEAASFGKPILCSSECNLQDLTSSGGAVLCSRNEADISKKLSMILKSNRLSEKLRSSSLKWFKKNYNRKTILRQYKKIYESI